MADTSLPPWSASAAAEAFAASNLFAFLLWDRALHPAEALVAGEQGWAPEAWYEALAKAVAAHPAAAAQRIAAFAGRASGSWLDLLGLLLFADLRPDDRIWCEGPLPPWHGLALSLAAGPAAGRSSASLLIAPHLPGESWPALRRIILTGQRPAGPLPRSITVTRALDWPQPPGMRESSAD